jgi:uncharacterized protein (DUF1778 family)
VARTIEIKRKPRTKKGAPKPKRMSVTIGSEDYPLLEEAAQSKGQSLSLYLVESAVFLTKAIKTVKEHA